MPILDTTVECPSLAPLPPSPPVSQAVLEVISSIALPDDQVVAVSITVSSETSSLSSFQLSLVGLGCVEDVTIISVIPSAELGNLFIFWGGGGAESNNEGEKT